MNFLDLHNILHIIELLHFLCQLTLKKIDYKIIKKHIYIFELKKEKSQYQPVYSKSDVITQLKCILASVPNREFVHNFRNKLTILYFSENDYQGYLECLVDIILWFNILYTLLYCEKELNMAIEYYFLFHNLKILPTSWNPLIGHFIIQYDIKKITIQINEQGLLCKNIYRFQSFDLIEKYKYVYSSPNLMIYQ